ncbi:MAG: MFS transporter [Anaerolineae bacterium]|nr:MFS transporter [Anaerolineae bacterium]MDW8068526.1 MFS transporter [Anaerolineae bacterium]
MAVEWALICAITFILFLDTHGLSPLIAPYVRALGAPVGLAGWIVGIFSVANLLGNLGGGLWTDRVGRKLPLVVGLLIVGTTLLVYPALRSPQALLLVRAVHGLGSALVAPACLASLGDTSLPTARGRTMAFYGVAYGMSGLVGPPLGGLIRDRFGYPAVFLGLAALMFLAALVAIGRLKGGRPLGKDSRPDAGAWRSLLRHRLSVSFVAAFCWMFALGTLLVFLPLIGEARGFTAARVGMLFGSFALAASLLQASPLGRLSDRWGRLPTIVLGLAFIAAALLLLSLLTAWGPMMGAMFLYGLGFGVLFPAKSALIADETTPLTRGKASGVFAAMFSVGMIAGTGMAGAMERWHQTTGLHPFQGAALVVLGGLLWAIAVSLTDRRKQRA